MDQTGWRQVHHTISLSSLPPIISATTHKPLRLGQRINKPQTGDAACARRREDGSPTPLRHTRKRKAALETAPQAVGKKKRVQQVEGVSGGGRRKGPLQIRDLVEGGIITPGRQNVAVFYKGVSYKADLEEDGSIVYEGRRFHAASTFSVHVKRLLTPNKQGDDGWKSVHVDGRTLEDWRTVYFERNANVRHHGVRGDRNSHKRKNPVKEREPIQNHAVMAVNNDQLDGGTDHWVQCSRCEVWRVVLPECWEGVESDTREDWFCEDADWDITQCHPFTGPCSA